MPDKLKLHNSTTTISGIELIIIVQDTAEDSKILRTIAFESVSTLTTTSIMQQKDFRLHKDTPKQMCS